MAAIRTIKGAKKGQDKARKPSIAKDTASSVSTVKILYGLWDSEGWGLVNGAKSIYLDETPVEDDAGNKNFEGVTWDFRAGTNEQEYIQGFPDVSNETPVGIELKSATPYIKAFTDSQLSALRVRFKWNRLSKTNADNGDVTGYKIDYAIDLKTGSGAYVEVLKTKIEDKLSAGYERTHRIDLPKSSTGWQLRIRRLTPNDASEYIQDTMMIEAIAEVIDVKLAYPNTALLGIQYNAETFSNIAKMEVHAKGSIIRVPSNYNAVNRTYSGIWDGTFKDAYSNNPAWAYYYLCTQWRFGLGERLDATMIDKWSLYALGQYCDQMVSDGQGGLEPRFTCNVYLQKQEDAYKVLQNIGGIFRAMSYWNGERIVLDADVPQDPVYTFSRANVVDGNFEYTGTRARDRHTLAKVAWDNPANRFETEYEYIRDEKAMAKFGVKVLDLSAFGCTSQAQAQRAGLWALKTEQLETRQVGFSVGLDGFIPQIGNVINISDELFAGRANGGRVSTVNATQRIIELDREVVAAVGDVLIINSANGKSQRRNISNVVGNRVTVTAAFDGAESEHVWAVETTDLKLMRFRVMSIQQNDDATFNITAIQHEPQKYDAIDFGTDVKPTDISIVNPETVDAPASVTITSRHREVQGQTVTTLVIGWTQVSGAVTYDVEWRKDDGTWIRVPRTGNTSAEIEGVYSGQYQAQVRAVSAFDVQSKPTTSSLTEVKGKVGLPPTIVGLTAIGLLFGMDLKWGFAQGSGDAAYTEIQVGSAPDVNVATLTQVAYPTNTHNITGMQGGLSQSYRGRIVDKLGNVSAWSAWVTATTDNNAEKVLDLIQGQINESSLNTILKTKIADIKITKDAIGNETTGIIADIIKANNRVTKEADDRIEALRLASLRTDGLQKSADNLARDVNTVTNAQVVTNNGLAAVKNRADAFEIENGVQAQKLDYLSSELDMGFTDATQYTNKARGTVWTFAKTVAHADYVNSQLITGLSADYKNSSARFTENINLLTTKNEAVATKTTNLSAQMTGGYNGSDLTKLTSGLVFEESKARANDVEGLAEQISLLSAGVGEQFDSFEIWHFNNDKDGWTNGTYNSGGWLNVRAETITSPAIADLDGVVYKHIKLRIKKVGTPTWQGLLSYTSGSKTIAEPSYDEDGIALVNWQLEWSGDITSFSLKLASAGDNLNYYSIDWIAVGRPSPGASNASLLRESKVRSSETSANASDLVSLRAKIEGGNGVPIESSITKKLKTTANLASTTAVDLSKLNSKYEGDMYGYEGTVQTTARTLASATRAEAERLDVLSANVLPSYTDAAKYTDATRSVQWTYAKTVAADNYAANQRITNLQSDFVNSSANVTNELFTLTEKDKSIAASVTQLYAKTDENYGLIQDLSLSISTPTTGLAAKVTELQSSSSENKDAAAAAQEAADNAATAAGNKGEVIYQWQTPAAARQLSQNLWIDTTGGKNTPKRWDGSEWVIVTDKAATDAQVAADAANEKLLPENLGSLVEQSGVFSTDFGSIAGKFTNIQGVVDSQKSAIETISAVGNAERLKNEIAKARLDKNATNLNAQSVALTNSINSYTTKIADLVAKRDAPKKADVTQDQYIALQAEYNKQIADITAAKADLTAQKDLITPQIAQLAAEKKVLDDFKEVEDNVRAQHTIKIDADDGTVIGYGLVLDKNGVSDFNIRANNINFLPPKSGTDDGVSQFVVRNTTSVIDGVTVPAGVYARHFYAPRASIDTIQIKDAAIKTAQIDALAVKSANIDDLAVTSGKIANLSVDTLKIADYAVTIPAMQFDARAFSFSATRVEQEINTITLDPKGGSVAISFGFDKLVASAFGSSTGATVLLRLKRDNTVLRTLEFKSSTRVTGLSYSSSSDRYDVVQSHELSYQYSAIAPYLDEGLTAGSHTYSVTLEGFGVNENRIDVLITGRTLQVTGVKK
ncbi:host specificity protein J [Psychrobacter sp. BF1]|uniref:host specificity protein J n=1 Tax=Psychrobacter sp. BF1 TaxID=2821147 RepID=UPI001C4DF592|nr:phage tail protein [Psychrobacter sp. BF1]